MPDGGAAADLAFHAFPTLDQLADATEQALRDSGFGYRCGVFIQPDGFLQSSAHHDSVPASLPASASLCLRPCQPSVIRLQHL